MRKRNLTIRNIFLYATTVCITILAPQITQADTYSPFSILNSSLLNSTFQKIEHVRNSFIETSIDVAVELTKNLKDTKTLAEDIATRTSDKVTLQVSAQSASVSSSINGGLEKVFGFAIDKTANFLTPFFIKKEINNPSILVENSNTKENESTKLNVPPKQTYDEVSNVVNPTNSTRTVFVQSNQSNSSENFLIKNILDRLSILENKEFGNVINNYVSTYTTGGGGGSYSRPADTTPLIRSIVTSAISPLEISIAALSGSSSGSSGSGTSTVATSTILEMFSNTATGLTYDNSTGITSLTSGYSIPLTASTTEWTAKVSSPWSRSNPNIYYTAGSVGIGTASPDGVLTVYDVNRSDHIRLGYDIDNMYRIGRNISTGVLEFEGNQSNASSFSFITSTGASTSTVMTLTNSGRLGLGSTTPSARLAITGSGASTGKAFVIANSSNVEKFSVTDSGALSIAGNLSLPSTTQINFTGNYNDPTTTTWTLGDVLTPTGAGINTARALTMSLYGASNQGFLIRNESNTPLFEVNGDGTKVYFAGNVGIGTTTPTKKLSVSGDSIFNGNVTLGSTTLGSLLFAGTSGLISENNASLFWDIDNYRLGVGSAGFTAYLGDSLGFGVGSGYMSLDLQSASGSGTGTIIADASGGDSTLYFNNANTDSAIEFYNNDAQRIIARMSAGTFGIYSPSSAVTYFNSSISDTGLVTFDAGGSSPFFNFSDNVGIGSTTPSARLAITGTAGIDDVFKVASSTNANLLSVSSNGNTIFGSKALIDSNGAIRSVNTNGAGGFYINSGSVSSIGSAAAQLDGATGLKLSKNHILGWVGGFDTSAVTDIALYRNAAGSLEINDGTPGSWRDLVVRNISVGTTSTSTALTVLSSTDVQAWIGTVGSPYGYTIGRNNSTGFLDILGNQSPYSGINVDQIKSAGPITVNGVNVLTNWTSKLGVGSGSGTAGAELEIRGGTQDLWIGGGAGSQYSFQRNSSTGIMEITGYQGAYTGYNFSTGQKTDAFTIVASGNVGISTTTPGYALTVAGDISLTGALRANGNAGTAGMVLLSQGSSVPTWVATSTLGIGGSSPWTISSSNIYYNTGNVAVGQTTIGATYKLEVAGKASTTQLYIPNTSSATVGGIFFGANRMIHNYGTQNFFAGEGAGNITTTGTQNTAIGATSMVSLTSLATRNTALGYYSANGITSGQYNTFVGSFAGYQLTTAAYNTGIGYGALSGIVINGDYNIGLGYYAGDNITSGDRNITIGYSVDAASATGNDQLNIGNIIYGINVNGTGSTISTGNIGIATTTPDQKLTVNGNIKAASSTTNVGVYLNYTGASGREYALLSCYNCGSAGLGGLEVYDTTASASRAYIQAGVNGWQTPSDRRLKDNIETLSVLDRIDSVRGTSYTLKDSGILQIGVIAQEIKAAFPEAVSGEEIDGRYLGVSYNAIASIALQGVRELNTLYKNILSKIEYMALWFGDSGDRFTVQGMVCVDDVCVTKDQFKQILLNSGTGFVSTVSSSPSSTSDTTTSTSTSTSSTSTTTSPESSTDEGNTNVIDTSEVTQVDNSETTESSSVESVATETTTPETSTTESTTNDSTSSIVPEPVTVPETTPVVESASPSVETASSEAI